MSQDTIGDVIKDLRTQKWPSASERYWANRLEEAARTAPERVVRRRGPNVSKIHPDILAALRVELGLEEK